MSKREKITSSAVSSKKYILWQRFSGLFFDFFNVTFIITIGWFLIGWYTKGNLLSTGYQDWIYHAYRIESVETFGITSWTHVWSNGLNIWRAYPYIPYFLLSTLKTLSGLSTTQTMLWTTVGIFLSLRVLLYGALRWSGCGRLASLLGAVLSYSIAQQWITIKDFLAFHALILVPFYIMLWIKTIKRATYLPWLAAFAGISLIIHFVMGYTFIALWAVAFFISGKKSTLVTKILSISSLILCSLPFLVPYFGYGYSFSNPIYSSPQFLRETYIQQYFGLSLPFLLSAGFTWILVLFQTKRFPAWAKILLLFVTGFLLAVAIGPQGYFPAFFNKLQFSRALPILGLLSIFPIAFSFQALQDLHNSRFSKTLLVILVAIFVTESISIATLWSAQPVSQIEDVVQEYVQSENLSPKGEIYVANVSQATYFAPRNLRYAISYNEHLEPHPLAQRFRQLLRNEVTYTGVSATQVELINQYKNFLGVEYLFIPQVSPLVEALTSSDSGTLVFSQKAELRSDADRFSVLKNEQPIQIAYITELPVNQTVPLESLEQPTLEARSWSRWDQIVQESLAKLQADDYQTAEVTFIDQNEVEITWNGDIRPKTVLVHQSYDQNWAASVEGATIQPTSLRMMAISLPENYVGKSLTLTNNWPIWHWPLQILGIVSFLSISAATLVYVLMERTHETE